MKIRAFVGFTTAVCTLLAGCTSPPARSDAQTYRCEHGIEFSARFVDDSAILDGSRGYDVVHRAPGSKERSYKNPRMVAEFGLGANGREALLRYPLLPLVARCAQD